jgi:hypothetical protein
MLGELLVQFALAGELEHEKDAFLVMEVAVQAEYVGVSKILLNLNFTSNLFFDTRLDNFGFVQAFEGEDVLRLAFSADHVNAPEFALS